MMGNWSVQILLGSIAYRVDSVQNAILMWRRLFCRDIVIVIMEVRFVAQAQEKPRAFL